MKIQRRAICKKIASKTLAYRALLEDYKAFDEICKKKGVTKSMLLEKVIADFIKKESK